MRNLRQYNSKYTSRIVAAVLILAVLPLVSWASRPFVTEDAGVQAGALFKLKRAGIISDGTTMIGNRRSCSCRFIGTLHLSTANNRQ